MKILNLFLSFLLVISGIPAGAWDQANSKVLQVDQASGVSSTPNYWKSGDAEVTLTGVAAYADAAGAKPTDCTGGSPAITVARSTTAPMYDKQSWLITKPASDVQGQGVAFEFDVDNGVAAVEMMDLMFDYIVGSGTFAAGSDTTNSDLMVYLYDVTAGKLIEPYGGSKLYTSSTTLKGDYRGWFQSTLGSKKYRVCLHQALNTSATGYTLKVDAGKVQKSKQVVGTIITDWKSYTPTISAASGTLTNYTVSETQWIQVGPNAYYRGRITFTGSPGTWSGPQITLPAGQQFKDISDLRILPSTVDLAPTGVGANRGNAFVWAVTSSIMRLVGDSGSGPTAITQAAPFTWASGNSMTWTVGPVPIVGWSAGARMSDLYSGQNIGAFIVGGGTGVTGVGSTKTKITGMSAPVDTVGMWDSTNQQLIIKATRNYRIDYGLRCESMTDAASFCQGQLYVNGTGNGNSIAQATTIALGKEIFPVHSVILPLKAGDILDLRGSISSGTATLGRFVSTYIRITEDSGTPFMSPTALWETHYAGTAGDAIGTTDSLIKFTTKVEDTFGSYNPATGLWTAKGPATCSASWAITSTSVNLSTSQRLLSFLRKTGTPFANGSRCIGNGVSNICTSIGSVQTIKVNTGDTLEIIAVSDVATSTDTTTRGQYFTVSCRQSGN